MLTEAGAGLHVCQVLDTPLPSMILQPIVENCVNHGIREMLGEGRISLEVFRIDDIVCVSIRRTAPLLCTAEPIDMRLRARVVSEKM